MENGPQSFLKRVATILANIPLAGALHRSLSNSLARPRVHLSGGRTPWHLFRHSLKSAISDIEIHECGKLFHRLFILGPDLRGRPRRLTTHRESNLSDLV